MNPTSQRGLAPISTLNPPVSIISAHADTQQRLAGGCVGCSSSAAAGTAALPLDAACVPGLPQAGAALRHCALHDPVHAWRRVPGC